LVSWDDRWYRHTLGKKKKKDKRFWFLNDGVVAMVRILLSSQRDHVKEGCQDKAYPVVIDRYMQIPARSRYDRQKMHTSDERHKRFLKTK
jgi:hypothetical protein